MTERFHLATETPDAELVRRCRRGEKRAFVEIVARHHAMVCGVAFAILNDFAASEESDGHARPDEAAASEEEAQLVRESLERLPELYRLPLVLFYREGQSVRAVAESLGISEDAVKQRLARGREMLRERMEGVIGRVLERSVPGAVFT